MPDTLRRIQRLQIITIGWMIVEGAASLVAAWRARSPALLAFGGDSAIELLSAAVVFQRFRKHDESRETERFASRFAGILLLLLAAYVAAASAMTLLGRSEPKPSLAGIIVLLAAVGIMPWLAREKRRLSVLAGSAALKADAAESMLCAYLALIALAGLVINALWQVARADAVAALCLIPLIVREGREALKRKDGECCQ